METLKFAALVFIAVFVLQLPFINSPGYPEAAVGAHNILQGQVLYRDSWEMHAPGVFYLWAALFSVFGESLLVQKLAAITGYALASAVLFLTISKLVEPRKAAMAAFAYGAFVMFGLGELLVTQLPYTMLFVNLALYFAFEYVENRSSGMLALAGMSAGIAAIFKQNTGVYALGGVAVLIIAEALRGEENPTRKFGQAFRSAAALGAGFAAVIIPVALYFLANNALGDLVYQMFVNNFTEYPRREAVPPAFTAPVWLMAQILLALAAYALFASKKFESAQKKTLAASASGLLLLLVAFPRYTDAALYPAFGALLFALAAAGIPLRESLNAAIARAKKIVDSGVAGKALVTLVLLLLAFDAVAFALVGAKTAYRTQRVIGYGLAGNYSYYIHNDVSLYANSTLPRDAKIYQFGYNFDQLLSSNRPTTKHTYFLPAAIGGRNEQTIIDALEREKVPYVLLDENSKCENGSTADLFFYHTELIECSKYVPKLYAYINANYEEEKSFESGWKLLKRK